MRILHTADWHVGKKLGRVDRRGEFEQVFDEIVAIARDCKVDLVIVAGDLLDRAIAPYDAISLVLDALRRLADAAGQSGAGEIPFQGFAYGYRTAAFVGSIRHSEAPGNDRFGNLKNRRKLLSCQQLPKCRCH